MWRDNRGCDHVFGLLKQIVVPLAHENVSQHHGFIV
jgi:hypothetical protein